MAKNAVAKTFTVALDVDGIYRSTPPADITPPTVPENVVVTATPTNGLTVSWSPSTDAQTGVALYRVRYKLSSSGTWLVGGAPASAPLVIPDLSAGTYDVQVNAVDGAGNESAYSATVQRTISSGSVDTAAWPRLGAYLQGTSDLVSTPERVRRAINNVCIVFSPTKGNVSDINAHMTAIKALNAACALGNYGNFNEWVQTRPANAGNNRTIWDFIDTNNYWGRNGYPAGARHAIFGSNYGLNFGSPRESTGLIFGEWFAKYHLDSSGLTASLADWLMFDNARNTAFGTYDPNETGTGVNKNSATMRNNRIAALKRVRDYVRSRGKKVMYNGPQGWFEDYIDGIDDRAAMADIADGGIIEMAVGNWNSKEGVFFYKSGSSTDTPSLDLNGSNPASQYNAYPSGSSFGGTPPANGTMCRNTFGTGWSGTGKQKQKNLLDFHMLGGEITDKKNYIFQGAGPMPGDYAGAAQHARYMFCLSQTYTDFMHQHVDNFAAQFGRGPSARGVMGVLDEYENGGGSWGTPLDEAGAIAGVWQSGVYRRRFYNAALDEYTWVFFNPIDNGAQTVNWTDGPSGYKAYRLNAATYGNQDPTTNSGALISATTSGSLALADRDGRVIKFRRS